MGRIFKIWAKRLFAASVTFVFVKGLFLFLSAYEIRPDIWVAQALALATNKTNLEIIVWIVSVVSGVLALVFWSKVEGLFHKTREAKNKMEPWQLIAIGSCGTALFGWVLVTGIIQQLKNNSIPADSSVALPKQLDEPPLPPAPLNIPPLPSAQTMPRTSLPSGEELKDNAEKHAAMRAQFFISPENARSYKEVMAYLSKIGENAAFAVSNYKQYEISVDEKIVLSGKIYQKNLELPDLTLTTKETPEEFARRIPDEGIRKSLSSLLEKWRNVKASNEGLMKAPVGKAIIKQSWPGSFHETIQGYADVSTKATDLKRQMGDYYQN